jgi:hypothetical protein
MSTQLETDFPEITRIKHPKKDCIIEGASQQVLSQHNIMNATNLCNDY